MPQISKPLIGHTTFTTSEKRRIGFLIGHTVFATSEESRIDFSRHWRPLTEIIQFEQQCRPNGFTTLYLYKRIH